MSLYSSCLFECVAPLVVDVLRCVQPCTLLGLEANVGPCLMRMARQKNSFGYTKTAVVLRKCIHAFRGQTGYSIDPEKRGCQSLCADKQRRPSLRSHASRQSCVPPFLHDGTATPGYLHRDRQAARRVPRSSRLVGRSR